MYLVIWLKPSKEVYYRVVKGTYSKYYVGHENNYSHKVLLVIDLYKELNISYKKKISIKDILTKYHKTCLKKLERR